MRHSGGVTHTVGSVEVESLEQFDRLRSRSRSMAGWFVQDLDLRDRSEALLTARPQGAVFLGCQMARHVEDSLRDRGALLFPGLVGLPFDPYRAHLYTATELYGDVAGGGAYTDSPDARSNAWRLAQGTPPDVAATLAMSLHDHSLGDALMDAVDRIDRAHVVGVMGGHDVVRGSRTYEDAAKLGLALTRAGMTVFTGGGRGVRAVPGRRRVRRTDLVLRARTAERVRLGDREVLLERAARGHSAGAVRRWRAVPAGRRRHGPGDLPGRDAGVLRARGHQDPSPRARGPRVLDRDPSRLAAVDGAVPRPRHGDRDPLRRHVVRGPGRAGLSLLSLSRTHALS